MSHQSDLISEDILAYLAQHERKELLRFLTCGNVDDGKSTLIGRLLHDSKMIYEDHLEAISRDSKKVGTTGEEVDLVDIISRDRYGRMRARIEVDGRDLGEHLISEGMARPWIEKGNWKGAVVDWCAE